MRCFMFGYLAFDFLFAHLQGVYILSRGATQRGILLAHVWLQSTGPFP